ncbi:mycofactocin precursor MftA [Calidifontibacter terrae]
MTEEIEQSDEATAAQTAATLLEDSLVEDVSIDGMCGVY